MTEGETILKELREIKAQLDKLISHQAEFMKLAERIRSPMAIDTGSTPERSKQSANVAS